MKVFKGVVISKKAAKTVGVEVATRFRHLVYGKTIRKTKKYQVQDESGSLAVGDKVTFVASKPYSKTKKWRTLGVVRKGPKKGAKKK